MTVQENERSQPIDIVLDEMINDLSERELEVAANATYPNPNKSRDKQVFHAKAYAQLFLESSEGNKEKALNNLKRTIQFRQELDVDCLRSTFVNPASKYQAKLKKSLSTKHVYVQGYDKDGRSTFIFIPRRVTQHDPVWTLREHIWTMEKAIACSRAPDKTANFVVDFKGFSLLSHTPPTQIGKDLMTVLRKHYAGRVNKIFLVDAPSTFICLWSIFNPFIGRLTRRKIHFVSSDEQKENVIGEWYTREEATPWMLPGGKKSRELNMDEYLHSTPYEEAFDAVLN